MTDSEIQNPPNILDAIIGSQTQNNLSTFEPTGLVSRLLTLLKERDRQILISRFGLENSEIRTLEAIGKQYNLTRERVRQIEKDSLAALRKKKLSDLEAAFQLIFDTVSEHGNIMSEKFLIETLLPGKSESRDRQAVKFLLSLNEQFREVKESPAISQAWAIVGFNEQRLQDVIAKFIELLQNEGRVLSQEQFSEKFRATQYFQAHQFELTESVLKSFLILSKMIQINPFNEIGLKDWSDVKPRDVGDKAYLVLKHHGKPEHYSHITKMINDHKFDQRVAYQETVHNELIKDDRFVLVGRGIYALTQWGYKKGVVADVIKEILKGASKPLARDEIISEVLTRRLVKRNTIMVGLSNRKHFQKIGKDKYTLAPDITP